MPIDKKTTFTNSNVPQKVNTVRSKTVNTARPKAVVNVVLGNKVNVVKASVCWVWKPKTKVIDHVSKHNRASITLKKFDYVDTKGRSNGCSRHMIGNMSYLTDYKEIDGGYVSFRGNPKGGKITGRGTKACDDAGKARIETVPGKDYILLPLWTSNPLISQESKSSQDDGFQPSSDVGKKVDEKQRQEIECKDQEKEDNGNSITNVNAAGTNRVNVVDDDDEADMNNMDTTIQVSRTPTTRIHKNHPLDQVIGDLHSTNQTRHISNNLEEHRWMPKVLFSVKRLKKMCMFANLQDLMIMTFLIKCTKLKKSLYGLHQAPRAWYEISSMYLLDNGFHKGKIDKTLFIRSQDKYVAEILKKYGFLEVKNASTPMETQKLLLKGEDGKEVDVYIYRSMIGSLMYLTSSRPDIMFAVCACARY
uniref:Reverse transcriptase Ty1/copia-type domain-containing protein n=1 Tax=Tanacetum cinerariifolium TaxID=118510 RepID=A0A6L2NW16_TANCI|nr:hypothetical protein [Tanacetum cinerariifolium]